MAREPVGLHEHAEANLRFIRQTIERAGPFTAVPGWGGIGMGCVALAAAWVAYGQACMPCWVKTWLGAAAVGFPVGLITMMRKARRLGTPMLAAPGRRFALSLAPAFVTAAVLTAALVRAGEYAILPGLWLLLYGAGITASGASSVRVVPMMGGCFLVLGAGALLAPAWGDLFLAAGFGAVQIGFGVLILRRHGG